MIHRYRHLLTIGELKPYGVGVVIEDYNPDWPMWFAVEQAAIGAALGSRALRIEHTGSTAVPGLAAKSVIDILLLVLHTSDEQAYVPDLEGRIHTACPRTGMV